MIYLHNGLGFLIISHICAVILGPQEHQELQELQEPQVLQEGRHLAGMVAVMPQLLKSFQVPQDRQVRLDYQVQ